jgi:hypothetical protein
LCRSSGGQPSSEGNLQHLVRSKNKEKREIRRNSEGEVFILLVQVRPCSLPTTVEPAYKNMLKSSDLTRTFEALTGQRGSEDTLFQIVPS